MASHDPELHDDDRPVGRVLSRREWLALLGGGSAALLAGMALPRLVSAQGTPTPTPNSATKIPSCVARPELSEGPFFVDEHLNRVDVRSDPASGVLSAGIPLLLTYQASQIVRGACQPLPKAQVDIWHCDAAGAYSDVPGTEGVQWLRGYQVTDKTGFAQFLTIVPGWYPGRAVHIHFKIQVPTSAGGLYEFTSQLFFDPQQIEEAYQQAPYKARGLPNVENSRDGIYRASGGVLDLTMAPMDAATLKKLKLESGLATTFEIGLDLTDQATGASDRW
jgi:protocatechuate 3,4-dioxygenase beta subunit